MKLFSKNALVTITAIIAWFAISSPAGAGMFTTGTFSTPADAGLNDNTGIIKAVVIGPVQSATPTAVATVGAVTFDQNTVGGPFGVGFESSWTAQHTADASSTTLPAFSDANLNLIMNPFSAVGGTGSTLSGTLTGLSIGGSYQLQFLIYDGDKSPNIIPVTPTSHYRGTTTIKMTNGAATDTLSSFNDMALLGNPDPIPNNQGVYIDYKSTAAASSLNAVFTVDGNGTASSIVLSDFDLRVVPEPASASLIGVGSLLILRRRRVI